MEVATSLEDKEEADETPLLKEILLKSTWKILLMGFTVCLLLFLVGLGVDALIWSATPHCFILMHYLSMELDLYCYILVWLPSYLFVYRPLDLSIFGHSSCFSLNSLSLIFMSLPIMGYEKVLRLTMSSI